MWVRWCNGSFGGLTGAFGWCLRRSGGVGLVLGGFWGVGECWLGISASWWGVGCVKDMLGGNSVGRPSADQVRDSFGQRWMVLERILSTDASAT